MIPTGPALNSGLTAPRDGPAEITFWAKTGAANDTDAGTAPPPEGPPSTPEQTYSADSGVTEAKSGWRSGDGDPPAPRAETSEHLENPLVSGWQPGWEMASDLSDTQMCGLSPDRGDEAGITH